MNIRLRKFQEGGSMAPQAAQEGAPTDQNAGQQDPIAELLNAAAQAVQSQDCQTAIQVCQALVQMASQNQQGGAPEEQAPEEGEPVYRAGGKLVGRITK